jgi:hypothetical protein
VQERENRGPGQWAIATAENLSALNPSIERLECTSQEREGRLGGIQNLKPAAEGGRICHPMGIFHWWCRRFPGTAFDKVAPQRLTAGDQTVMAVGKRKHGQEGNRLLARSADTAPNGDPVMVFVVSLLLPAAMPNDRILRANWAPAKDYFCARFRPIGIQLALRRGKWDKDNRANGLCPGYREPSQGLTQGGAFAPFKNLSWKRISNSAPRQLLAPQAAVLWPVKGPRRRCPPCS